MRYAPMRIPFNPSVNDALNHPTGTLPLFFLAKKRQNECAHTNAVIVVSDNTRPVPYRGEHGILLPILDTLRNSGLRDENVTILIGCGSHRNMHPDEQEQMLGLKASGRERIRVINHEYDDTDSLKYIGRTQRGSRVYVNRHYLEADIKIVTGLVESHFMAGASGGRKGICPAIVGQETLEVFHSAALLGSPNAADLVIDGNPVHEEALEIAKMAGCDFLVNVTLDGEKGLTGVFAGDMVAAHRAAVEKFRDYVVVDLERKYDIVLIPAGYVGVNHYQAGKAAVVAARAVRKGGQIIIVARNTDPDPIGGEGYKRALHLLHRLGKNKFMEMIREPEWSFIQEQWQVQMWCKVLEKLGAEDHLYYCALEIPEEDYRFLPGIAGMTLLNGRSRGPASKEARMTIMVEHAVREAIKDADTDLPGVLFLQDGPYGIPVVDGT